MTTLRALVANTPESGKRGLLRPPRKRARRLFRQMNRRRITVAMCQESGKHASRQASRRKWWRQIAASPNSRAWGNVQRNTIFAKSSQARVVERKQLTVSDGPVGPSPRVASGGQLHIPIALLERRSRFPWKRVRFVAISGHVPTGHSAMAYLRGPYSETLRGYLQELGGVPVIIGADTNSGAGWADPFRPLGYQVAHRHGVDVLLVSSHFRVSHRRALNRPRLSDHNFIEARLHVQCRGRQLARLP